MSLLPLHRWDSGLCFAVAGGLAKVAGTLWPLLSFMGPEIGGLKRTSNLPWNKSCLLLNIPPCPLLPSFLNLSQSFLMSWAWWPSTGLILQTAQTTSDDPVNPVTMITWVHFVQEKENVLHLARQHLMHMAVRSFSSTHTTPWWWQSNGGASKSCCRSWGTGRSAKLLLVKYGYWLTWNKPRTMETKSFEVWPLFEQAIVFVSNDMINTTVA